jgi:hypothetical protein
LRWSDRLDFGRILILRYIKTNAAFPIASESAEESCMPAYFLMLSGANARAAKRMDFVAESPDQAFQVARNVTDGTRCERWEGDKLLARMTKSGDGLWQLLATTPPVVEQPERQPMLSKTGMA